MKGNYLSDIRFHDLRVFYSHLYQKNNINEKAVSK